MDYIPAPRLQPAQFTTFPAKNLPEPRISLNLRYSPVLYRFGKPPEQTCFDRWFCCRCADRREGEALSRQGHGTSNHPHPHPHAAPNDSSPDNGGRAYGQQHGPIIARKDVGMINDDHGSSPFARCTNQRCGHKKCGNCGLNSPSRWSLPYLLVARTVGGLYASPSFIDPAFWECPCGEWQHNLFDGICVFEDAAGGGTSCANPGCAVSNWKSGRGRLTCQSVVMNRYGERLGTADQSVMVENGPWHLQRQALGDRNAALIRSLRPPPFRSLGPVSQVPPLWRAGEPAPDYPQRPEPPIRDSDNRDKFLAWERGYLVGIPWEPVGKGPALSGSSDDEPDSDLGVPDTPNTSEESSPAQPLVQEPVEWRHDGGRGGQHVTERFSIRV